MLKKYHETGRDSEPGKPAGRFWVGPGWTWIFCVTLPTLFPIAFWAQTTSPTASGSAQVTAFGAGNQTPLRFQGESVPTNQMFLSVGASTFYDDDVFATNSRRAGDEAFSIDSHVGITRQTERLTASFNYSPFFLLYRQMDQYDRLNHSASLGLTYRLTSRFSLGLYDTISYQNGVYPSLAGQQIMSGLASPTALNQMIVPYTVRTLSDVAGLGLTFVKSQRTSLTFSGNYIQEKYGNQTPGQPLYNANGASGGMALQYRLTEHTSFGILLLHQDTTYRGGHFFGYRLRSQVESTFFSVGSSLSPTVTVTVFIGPQYIRTIGQESAGVGLIGHFQTSGGASITKEVRRTALDLSVQRSISDGGGLYASVIDNTATFGVRRQLVGHWEAGLHGGVAQADPSLFQNANGRTDALTASIGIERPFSHGAVFRISYVTWHQLSHGTLPNAANYDRDQVTVGIDYQLKAIPFGR